MMIYGLTFAIQLIIVVTRKYFASSKMNECVVTVEGIYDEIDCKNYNIIRIVCIVIMHVLKAVQNNLYICKIRWDSWLVI